MNELEVNQAQVEEAEGGEDQEKEKRRSTTQRSDVLPQFHDDHRSLRT
jgi:hypothetical protein